MSKLMVMAKQRPTNGKNPGRPHKDPEAEPGERSGKALQVYLDKDVDREFRDFLKDLKNKTQITQNITDHVQKAIVQYMAREKMGASE